MKIVVFGGAGFLGSHVADALTESGHDVTVFDQIASPYLKENQSFAVGDIADTTKVNKAVEGSDAVYHFAGIADLEDAKKDPLATIRSNILGTGIILETCRHHRVKRFVFASTLYVYSNSGSFYRSSKQACELLIDNYQEVYNLDYTIIRYGSLYGPRAGDKNWLNRTIKDAVEGKKLVRHGDGEELRDYIHVYDAARLSVDALDPEYKNQHVIITGIQQIKIKDIMLMIREMLNNEIEIEFQPVDSNDHYEITPYNFNPRLAKRIHGSNYVDLGQGILDLMGTMYKDNVKHRKHNGIYVRD